MGETFAAVVALEWLFTAMDAKVLLGTKREIKMEIKMRDKEERNVDVGVTMRKLVSTN